MERKKTEKRKFTKTGSEVLSELSYMEKELSPEEYQKIESIYVKWSGHPSCPEANTTHEELINFAKEYAQMVTEQRKQSIESKIQTYTDNATNWDGQEIQVVNVDNLHKLLNH